MEPKVQRERPVLAADVQAAITDFVTRTVTLNRLDQGLDALEQQGIKTEKRNTGAYIKWVSGDVERECARELAEAGLLWTQVSGLVAITARDYFLATVK